MSADTARRPSRPALQPVSGGSSRQPDGPSGKAIYLAVDDADEAFARASAAGATILQGLTDRDYGSREFICQDPEGNLWSVGTYWPKVT